MELGQVGEPGIVTLEERMACNHEYKEQLGAENYSMLIVVIYNYLIMKSRELPPRYSYDNWRQWSHRWWYAIWEFKQINLNPAAQ